MSLEQTNGVYSDTGAWIFLDRVGLSIADSRCVLSTEHLLQLGALLLSLRLSDQPISFAAGGLLSALASSASGSQQLIPLADPFGDGAWLIMTGLRGVLALLATEEAGGYRVLLCSDTDSVDRLVLVLSQFDGEASRLDTSCDPVTQSGFIVMLIAALLGDPIFRTLDLAALLPAHGRWLDLARMLTPRSGGSALLTTDGVRRLFAECGCGRVLLGQLLLGQQLQIIAAKGDRGLAQLPASAGLLADVVQTGRMTYAPPGAYQDQLQQGDGVLAWARGDACVLVPLLKYGRVWGVLLAAGKRSFSEVSRATLGGLSALLAAYIDDAAPSPAEPLVDADSAILPTSGWESTLPVARSVVQQPRDGELTISPALLEHLSDGVLISDARGRIVTFNRLAAQWTGLSEEASGSALIESDAWMLAALLSEAVMGEALEPRVIELVTGQAVRVAVVEGGKDLWAFVIQIASDQ